MGTAERRFSRLRGCFPRAFVTFSLWDSGFLSLFSEVRGEIGNLRAHPDFSQQNRRLRKGEIGVWFPDLGFTPHFRNRPPEVCGKFRNPRAHRPFHEKNPQLETLSLFSVVSMSRIYRILPEWAPAWLGCLSIWGCGIYLILCYLYLNSYT